MQIAIKIKLKTLDYKIKTLYNYYGIGENKMDKRDRQYIYASMNGKGGPTLPRH